MSDYVFDASALLSLILSEPGQEEVRKYLAESKLVSAVNLAETTTRLLDLGYSERDASSTTRLLRLDVVAFDEAQATAAALLRQQTRQFGLSLGDRACLALARQIGCPAVTADRNWTRLTLNIRVLSVRP